jgi:ferrous iron transport protein A
LTAGFGLGYPEIEILFQIEGDAGADMSRAEASTGAAHGAVSLASLRPGAWGRIDSVDSSSPVGRRLEDLGFLPRTEIHVLRSAPLGDPVIYELRGYRLCLRRSEASRVRVVPIDPQSGAAP